MANKKVVTGTSSQTVLDITLQTLGDADKTFELISANPSIENIHSDISGLDIEYELSSNYNQRYYIAQNQSVANKPIPYKNSLGPFILCENGNYLTQENTYKFIV